VNAVPALPPPAIEQPAPRQASFGLVTGVAARGTRRVVVSVRGRVLADKPVRGRRFSLHVALPTGEVSVRVTTFGTGGRHSVRVVDEVLGLPAAARPRIVASHEDPTLARRVRKLARDFGATSGIYLQSLTDGSGAAWNATARFPAASTLKLAIATTVLASYMGVPRAGSNLDALLRQMITLSDNASANALEVWLAGSTSAGSDRVNALMRSVGLTHSLMYGGYETHTFRKIPLRVDEQPAFGIGKYTTAWDLASLLRSVWLASGGRGPLHDAQPGFTAADGRYLLWILAHVRDTAKLDRIVGGRTDVAVLHKAGWVDTARHDAGLVFWRGGVFVASVMTWSSRGAGVSSDVLAGRCAAVALERFRWLHR
jgi:beta-lactamase class A